MTLTFAVLGDSIAYGQGASRPADTIGSRLAAELTAAGTPVELRVFAVPGARSEALTAQTERAVNAGAGLALIVVGANDLTHFVPPQVAADQLREAVRALRAGGCEVVVVPAPDLSAVPWIPSQFRGLVQAASDVLRQAQSSVALAEGARVADVNVHISSRFTSDSSLFCADRFHPSSAGYALIAQAIAPAVFAAAAAAVDQAG